MINRLNLKAPFLFLPIMSALKVYCVIEKREEKVKGEVRKVAGANRKIRLLVLRLWKKTVTWQPKGKGEESSARKKRKEKKRPKKIQK